jgi:hypothetical protein
MGRKSWLVITQNLIIIQGEGSIGHNIAPNYLMCRKEEQWLCAESQLLQEEVWHLCSDTFSRQVQADKRKPCWERSPPLCMSSESHPGMADCNLVAGFSSMLPSLKLVIKHPGHFLLLKPISSCSLLPPHTCRTDLMQYYSTFSPHRGTLL